MKVPEVERITMENIITIENLHKDYKTYKRGTSFKANLKSFFHRQVVLIPAVNDVSFSVRKGSITGVLGPNGAGKSTLIKMMTGTLFPTSGKIDVMGYNPSKSRTKYVQHIGAVFGQKSQLIWDIPPADSFMMNAAIYDIPKKEYQERLKNMTELFELGEVIYKPTRVLSLGERMKCEFIMAMLHNPPVVFLDEPTIGLDVIAKQKIRHFISEMNKQGTTFILTTHDLEDVEQLAQEVIIINHGQKVFDGDLHTLRNTLGEKKIVTLTFEKQFSGDDETLFKNIKGTKLLNKVSDMEYEIEADMKIIKTPALLKQLSENFPLKDISVRELPMEEIITKIYTE